MSRKPVSHKPKDIKEGEGIFVMHYLELLTSDAWLEQSVPCRRLIDFLEIEHLRHGGYENGNLNAPRVQLIEFGIGRNDVEKARSEAVRRGLIDVRGGERVGSRNAPILYRLTFRKTYEADGFGKKTCCEPTHEWRRFVGKRKRKQGVEGHEKVTVTEEGEALAENRNEAHQKVTMTPRYRHEKVTMTPQNDQVLAAEYGGNPPFPEALSRSPFGDPSIYSGRVGDSETPNNNSLDHGHVIFGPPNNSISDEPPAEPFGARVKTLRTRLGLSQAQLGQLTGIGARWVEKIEAGRYAPEGPERLKILGAIACYRSPDASAGSPVT